MLSHRVEEIRFYNAGKDGVFSLQRRVLIRNVLEIVVAVEVKFIAVLWGSDKKNCHPRLLSNQNWKKMTGDRYS